LRHDYVRTVEQALSAIDDTLIARIYAEQAPRARPRSQREGVPVDEIRRVIPPTCSSRAEPYPLGVDRAARYRVGRAARDLLPSLTSVASAFELPEIPRCWSISTLGDRCAPACIAQASCDSERAPTLKAAQVGERRVWFIEGCR